MHSHNYQSLSEAINDLTINGYTESFTATDHCIKAANSKKEYTPTDLVIVKNYRFDGMTNPSDESELFAIEALDGAKGTIVISYSSQHNHNIELIKKIPQKG